MQPEQIGNSSKFSFFSELKIGWIVLLHFLFSFLVLVLFDGTGDEGDSVYHYLFAKYAPVQKALFFDHWAKPVYVFLASPFAQLGMFGVKLLNVLLGGLSLFYTFKVAKLLKLPNPSIAALLLLFQPLYFVLLFSGLTEPMFAFFAILATYFYLKNNFILSLIIISFLPLLRSEGLFFIGIFGLLLFVQKKWKLLPWLLVGSVIYGMLGWPVHGTPFWVFAKVPYAKMSSTYGSGDAFHYVEQLFYVIGIPIYILFWLGFLKNMVELIKSTWKNTKHLLIYGTIVAFIVAHSIFWYFGIFNSMGLKRVLICLTPFIAIAALEGWNTLTELFPKKVRMAISILIIGAVVLFPFTKNKAAIDFRKDFSLTISQQAAQKTVLFLNENHIPFNRLVTAHPFFCELLSLNCFDPNQKVFLNEESLANLTKNDIVIWETWFAVVEQGITEEDLNRFDLETLYELSAMNEKNRVIQYKVLRKK